MSQNSLNLFEGKRVECVALKLQGDPDQVADPAAHGDNIAVVVTGKVDEVSFYEKDGRVVRKQTIKMRRLLQIPYDEALELITHEDKRRREGEGVYELPFEDK